jgi:hypothetical protein
VSIIRGFSLFAVGGSWNPREKRGMTVRVIEYAIVAAALTSEKQIMELKSTGLITNFVEGGF